MKKKLTDNLGLKILAVLCSVLLWIIVMNIDDPVKPYTFRNIPVEIVNQQVLTDEGKVYEVLDETNLIDVTIQAKRSVLNTIGRENIIAVADLSELTFMNTVRIKLSTDKYNDKLENIKASEENLKLNVENLKRVQVIVETVVTGEPGSGYMVDSVSSEQNLVRLSGAESAISQVDRAVLEVSVEGITTGIQADYPVKLYDANGKEVDGKNITKSVSNIGVKIGVLQQKQVGFAWNVSGAAAPGYQATGEVISNPESVLIAGSSSTLAGIGELEMPAEILDITGADSDVVTLVDIEAYLPDGVKLADAAFNGKASVTVSVEQEQNASVEVKPADIAIRGLPANLEGTVGAEEESFTVEVAGLAQHMTGIAGTTVTGYVDASTLAAEDDTEQAIQAGVYHMPVTLNLPEGVTAKTELTVTVTLESGEETQE